MPPRTLPIIRRYEQQYGYKFNTHVNGFCITIKLATYVEQSSQSSQSSQGIASCKMKQLDLMQIFAKQAESQKRKCCSSEEPQQTKDADAFERPLKQIKIRTVCKNCGKAMASRYHFGQGRPSEFCVTCAKEHDKEWHAAYEEATRCVKCKHSMRSARIYAGHKTLCCISCAKMLDPEWYTAYLA